MNSSTDIFSSDAAVAERYGAAANEREEALCCPVSYDPKLLEIIPQEIIEKDYGCGDPSAHLKAGDVVVDLGSGGGKLCYMAAQIVGPTGIVIGVDCNLEMLSLARKYQGEMAEKLGYNNVEFRYGRIQDLALDLDRVNAELKQLDSSAPSHALDTLDLIRSLRTSNPMIPNDSVDCVISNCVLNLVNPDDRKQLFAEIYRVLRNGGRAAISDIVCDEDVPMEMQQDAELWSGCLSGAWREDLFLEEFAKIGFHGIQISSYQSEPWQTINGIEFRSMTVTAYKGKEGPCLERNQAVIYKGPFDQVFDDDNNVYPRGHRVAVCDKTFRLLMQAPYDGMFLPVEPLDEIPIDLAKPFDCNTARLRSAKETKGQSYSATMFSELPICDPNGGCC